MYADQVAAGSKRSIKDRLDGDLGRNHRPSSSAKRQRRSDNKWKRDLYDDDREPQPSKPKVGPRDLRLQLQKKSLQQTFQGGRDSGVRDLREKLSGTMHSQPPNIDLPNVATGISMTVKKIAPSGQAPLPEIKKTPNPTSSKMKTLQKSYSSVGGLLQSLGLQKYLITLQAEEVDMTALMHMTDEDLKVLGIPMVIDRFMPSIYWDRTKRTLYGYEQYAREAWQVPDWYNFPVYGMFFEIKRPIIRDIEDGAEVYHEKEVHFMFFLRRHDTSSYPRIVGYEGTMDQWVEANPYAKILQIDDLWLKKG